MQNDRPDTPPNLFKRKFKVIIAHYCERDQQWRLFKDLGHKDLIWEFIERPVFVTYRTATIYEGKLREHFERNPVEETRYTYYASESLLLIDRSHYVPDGRCSMYVISARYRVEYISDGEYWLNDLENVQKEPDDYRFRLKLRRIQID